MTITFRGKSSASATSNSSTSMSVPVPSSATPLADDLLLTWIEDAGTSQPTVTAPSGWTLIPSSVIYSTGTTGSYQACYSKRATGTESAETWGWVASFGAVIAQSAYYTTTSGAIVNVDKCAAAAPAAGTTGSTTRTTPSLTVAAGMLIEFHNDLNQSNWSGFTGTARHTLIRSASLSCLIADSVVTAGTYTRTATSDKSTIIRTDGLLSLVETVLGITAPTANAGTAQTVDPNLISGASFTLTGTGAATTSGATVASYTWRLINSTAGFTQASYAMTGSGATRTLRTATAANGDVSTWGLIVTDSNGTTSTESTVVITALSHNRWLKTASGVIPVRRKL